MENNIKNIVEEILNANVLNLLEMNEWSDKDKIVYLKKITDMITNRTIIIIIEKLTSEEVEEFKKLMDVNEENGWKYLNTKVPNIKEIAAAEAAMAQIEIQKDVELYKKVLNEKNNQELTNIG